MPKRRFTEERIINILRETELTGGQIRELCRKYGIAEQTFYRWRQEYGGHGAHPRAAHAAEGDRRPRLAGAHARVGLLQARDRRPCFPGTSGSGRP
jgi:putative transposase